LRRRPVLRVACYRAATAAAVVRLHRLNLPPPSDTCTSPLA